MSKAKTAVSGSDEDQCEGFKENSKQMRTTVQPARASALDILLDISTNVHPVIDTSDVATVSFLHNYTVAIFFVLARWFFMFAS